MLMSAVFIVNICSAVRNTPKFSDHEKTKRTGNRDTIAGFKGMDI